MQLSENTEITSKLVHYPFSFFYQTIFSVDINVTVLPEKIWNQLYLLNSYYLSRAKVGELLSQVSSPKIHLQYAKAKEADGRYF